MIGICPECDHFMSVGHDDAPVYPSVVGGVCPRCGNVIVISIQDGVPVTFRMTYDELHRKVPPSARKELRDFQEEHFHAEGMWG